MYQLAVVAVLLIVLEQKTHRDTGVGYCDDLQRLLGCHRRDGDVVANCRGR